MSDLNNSIRLVDQFRQQYANFTAYYEAWKENKNVRNGVNLAHTLGSFLIAANEVLPVAEAHGAVSIVTEVNNAMLLYNKYWKELAAAADVAG